ncbi:hypothetical protein K3495_g3975 [Podosphaera aphanis]|nr:hypothetical protein K3495_g3975 [Podosphaera aphanis]
MITGFWSSLPMLFDPPGPELQWVGKDSLRRREMASFFDFERGLESNGAVDERTPLLGRFRAVPTSQSLERRNYKDKLPTSITDADTLIRGYDHIFPIESPVSSEERLSETQPIGILKRWTQLQSNLWLEPKPTAVRALIEKWWSRWLVLIYLPAALPVAWCALPVPKQDLLESRLSGHHTSIDRISGHGAARVTIDFWYFLFVYYGIYNLIALTWITKVFNIYNLNWWPEKWGFTLTFSAILLVSVAVPIPIYQIPLVRNITTHNTAWICWTFVVMSIPLVFASTSLLSLERRVGPRNTLSTTQRIFTSSWWTSDEFDSISRRDLGRRSHIQRYLYDPHSLDVALTPNEGYLSMPCSNTPSWKKWISASFMRFIWFSVALFIAMLAYVMGEAYAEIYLRTLPHSTSQTIVYVYTWVVTVHLLDGLVGWILGGDNGQRVGSYPLGWTFKLYFSLTYQTYVRALYARLRSPSQFLVLQIISSSILIFLAPLTMCKTYHCILTLISINGQSLQQYQKFCARNIYIRNLSECVSMVTFLGSILVLHYGPNKNVYPYFAFDRKFGTAADQKLPEVDSNAGYDFGLTFYASMVTFACEVLAAWIVRRIVWLGWQINVTDEAIKDLSTWPEMLPSVVIVMVHVLQNMLFSIVRLRFY